MGPRWWAIADGGDGFSQDIDNRGRLGGCRKQFGRVFMKPREQLTAIIEREGTGYVSLCPELDIASQGPTVEEARANLREAVELFFEAADPSEVKRRLHSEVYVTRLDIVRG
jgi:predicted RNase H-like HicB family nuclease